MNLKPLALAVALSLIASPPALAADAPAGKTPAASAPAVKAIKLATVEGITEYTLPNGMRVLLAPDAPQFAAAVGQALAAPRPEMGRAARHTVESLYGWTSNLAPVVSLLEQMSVESA